MDIDNITDIEVLRSALKQYMVQLKETIETPTKKYKAGHWYNIEQDRNEVWIYDIYDDSDFGIHLSYDEADRVICRK